MVAPRAFASSARSSTMIPAPSPSTNPSRPLSNGRDACAGSSLRYDSARICAKPAIGSGCMHASVPPATTMSTRPARIRSRAMASASAPDAQADTGVCTPPRAPSSSPTAAAGPFGISIGTVSGETRRGPRSSSASYWPSSVSAPPMPLPTATASRSGSISGRPASAHASRAATTAVCWQRSSRRASTRSSTSEGSTARRAAIFAGRSSAQSSVSGTTPDLPASIAAQVDATSPPRGVVAPSPVMTTSVIASAPRCAGCTARCVFRASSGAGSRNPVLLDVADRVADGLQAGELVVRDLHAELVLGGQCDLDHGQRVDVQVVGEGLVGLDVLRLDAGDVLEDLGQAGHDLVGLLGGTLGGILGGRGGLVAHVLFPFVDGYSVDSYSVGP